MPIVQSAGQLLVIERAPAPMLSTNITLYGGSRADYREIYRTQPNVRTVVSFLARNIAQLPVHLYRRRADDDRERITDHDFVRALRQSNPLDRRITRFRLMQALVTDLAVYDVAYWAFVRAAGARTALIRLPAHKVTPIGDNWLWPEGYELRGNRGTKTLPADSVVQFLGSLNLDDPRFGTSPIESLRRLLAEDEAAGVQREQFWNNGARIAGVIERPADAPAWSDPARDRFRSSWNDYGSTGGKAGGTPILEDGMTYKEASASARDSQYVEARKLTRQEVAAAYHIHPAFVGILDQTNFANMREQHRSLYQDTLGPWLQMAQQDLEAQVLPEYAGAGELDDLYVEFNFAEKLRGSFEEQASALSSLVGRPILTANEARAIINRNRLEEGDGLVTPLNVIVGGQASPTDADNEPDPYATNARRPGRKAIAVPDRRRQALERQHLEAHRRLLERTFGRQASAVRSAFGARPEATAEELLDRDRFDNELATDLLGLALDTAAGFAEATADALAFDELDADVMLGYLAENSRIAAELINATTEFQIAVALDEDDPAAALGDVFALAAGARAAQIARTRVTSVAGFASTDTARQAGRSTKTWVTISANARESHAAVDGETVAIGDTFSLGGAWPGDPVMGVDEVAGCTCTISFD